MYSTLICQRESPQSCEIGQSGCDTYCGNLGYPQGSATSWGYCGNKNKCICRQSTSVSCSKNPTCPSGYVVYSSTPCTPTCSDGTLIDTCSLTKPKYCDTNLVLVDNPSQCGCPTGQVLQNGNCVNAKAQLQASYNLINTRNENGITYYDYESTISEIGGKFGVTIDSRQKCYQSRGCDPMKTNIAQDYGANYITSGNSISDPENYWYTDLNSETMTETFYGTDDNGNQVQASLKMTK